MWKGKDEGWGKLRTHLRRLRHTFLSFGDDFLEQFLLLFATEPLVSRRDECESSLGTLTLLILVRVNQS